MAQNTIWKDRKEEDLQDCVEEALEGNGYTCINLHKKQPAQELGADLECRDGDQSALLVQAKIRPVKSDIPQLRRLAARTAASRFYVAAYEPTVDFSRELERTAGVKFLSGTELHRFLLEGQSNTYLRYLLVSNKFVVDLIDCLLLLAGRRDLPRRRLSKPDLMHAWRLKSAVVQLRSGVDTLRHVYRDRLKATVKNDEAAVIIDEIAMELTNLVDASYETLRSGFERADRDSPHVLSELWKVLSPDSNWLSSEVKKKSANSHDERRIIEDWLLPRYGQHSILDCMDDYLHKFRNALDFLSRGLNRMAIGED